MFVPWNRQFQQRRSPLTTLIKLNGVTASAQKLSSRSLGTSISQRAWLSGGTRDFKEISKIFRNKLLLTNKSFLDRLRQPPVPASELNNDWDGPSSRITRDEDRISPLGVMLAILILYILTYCDRTAQYSLAMPSSASRGEFDGFRFRAGSKLNQSVQRRMASFLVGLKHDSDLGKACIDLLKNILKNNTGAVVEAIQTDLLKRHEFQKMVTAWFTEKAIEVCHNESTQDAMAEMIQVAIEKPTTCESAQQELAKVLASESTRTALAEALTDALNRSNVQASASQMSKAVLQNMANDSAVQNVLSDTMWRVLKRTIVPRWAGNSSAGETAVE